MSAVGAQHDEDAGGEPAYGSRLFAQHAAKLAASAVSVEVAAEREYRSCDTKAAMGSVGFGPAQRRPPALVIPLYKVWGEPAGYQCRPDEPRVVGGRIVKYETVKGQPMLLDVPPRSQPHLGNPQIPLVITEGPIKADALVSAGACAVALLGVWSWRGTNGDGGKVALADFEKVALNGRRVLTSFDSDVVSKPQVHAAMARLAALLKARGAEVSFSYLPSGDFGLKVGVDDFLAAGHTVDDLWATASDELRQGDERDDEPAKPYEPPPRRALADVERAFSRWMVIRDLRPLRAVLGAYAANMLPGDPVWLGVVGGSSRGKTELVASLGRCPHVTALSSISGPAALLSLTSSKERSADATGGILASIGEFGVIALKDMTTVLEMHRDARAQLLAALREVYDGSWSRHAGVDGGRQVEWTGKVGLVFGVTTAIDQAHTVMSSMGERLILVRVEVDEDLDIATGAMGQVGGESDARGDLAVAVAGLLAHIDYSQPVKPASGTMLDLLTHLATFVARSRSPVMWDRKGDTIELVGDPEAPARLVKSLERLRAGLHLIGLPVDEVADVIRKVGLDSIPKGRRQVLDAVMGGDGPMTTPNVAKEAGLPTGTAYRRLAELAAHGIVNRTSGSEVDGGDGRSDYWAPTAWAARLLAKITPEMSSYMNKGIRSSPPVRGKQHTRDTADPDVSGVIFGDGLVGDTADPDVSGVIPAANGGRVRVRVDP